MSRQSVQCVNCLWGLKLSQLLVLFCKILFLWETWSNVIGLLGNIKLRSLSLSIWDLSTVLVRLKATSVFLTTSNALSIWESAVLVRLKATSAFLTTSKFPLYSRSAVSLQQHNAESWSKTVRRDWKLSQSKQEILQVITFETNAICSCTLSRAPTTAVVCLQALKSLFKNILKACFKTHWKDLIAWCTNHMEEKQQIKMSKWRWFDS